MHAKEEHRWDVDYHEAVAIQERLARKVIVSPLPEVRLVVGVDVAYSRKRNWCSAAAVVFDLETRETVEIAEAQGPSTYPYVPGLLTFREAPPILRALERLETEPDVLLVDGQGLAHPRRMGIATHLGILLDRPTVGCAKSRLTGIHADPGRKKGSWADLKDESECIGRVLRTRTRVKPVFVSIGHRVDLPSAVRLVLRSVSRYRIPDPIRLAHTHVTAMRHEAEVRDVLKPG